MSSCLFAQGGKSVESPSSNEYHERWIVVVGFSDFSRLLVRLAGEEKQYGLESTYGFVCSNNHWLLQRLIETGEWYDGYSCDGNLTPLALNDFEEANSYYQTAPESYFVQGRICSRAMEDCRISLTDDTLIVTRNGQREEMPTEDEQAFVRALSEHFGIRII